MRTPESQLMRRREAQQWLGLGDKAFAALLYDPVRGQTGSLPAVYLSYEVRLPGRTVVCGAKTAAAYAARGHALTPLGYSYFRRSDLLALTSAPPTP